MVSTDLKCHDCKNLPNEVIDGKYCKAYTPQELYDCIPNVKEGFVVNAPPSSEYEINIGDESVFKYNFNDSNNKYVKHSTNVDPIVHVAGEPVIFMDSSTNQKYYFDAVTNSLIKYGDAEEPVNKDVYTANIIDYTDPNNVSNGLLRQTLARTTTTAAAAAVTTGVTSAAAVACRKLNTVEEEHPEEEESTNSPMLDKDVTTLLGKLKNTGLSKSFILSFIHEMDSKELKVKYIEDDREKLTDDEIDTLKKLNTAPEEETRTEEEIEAEADNNITVITNNDHSHWHTHEPEAANVVDTTPSLVTTVAPTSCPKLKIKKCGYGSTIGVDKNQCPDIKCNLKPTLSDNISFTTKIVLYFISISVILLFLLFIQSNHVN